MTQPANPWLSCYAKVVVAATFFLILIGGMVTTVDAGMSVPDWPTTFGHNMFTFPFEKWVGPVFWEHSHRIVASAIGLLTTILAVWLFLEDRRRWVKVTGLAAFLLVVLQGIMGGLRVTEKSIVLAILHGCLAQAFLCILVLLALAVSPVWNEPAPAKVPGERLRSWKRWGWALVIVVYLQLVFGAIMRHLKAGLAIPTFPLTPEGTFFPTVHSMAIDIHFTHRLWALVVTGVALVLAFKIFRWANGAPRFVGPVFAIVLLLLVQIALGALVIFSSRASIPTTLHVINGAAILVLSLVVTVRASHYASRASSTSQPAPLPAS